MHKLHKSRSSLNSCFRAMVALLSLCLAACSSGGEGDGDGCASAPDTFVARFETSAGTFRIEVDCSLAPRGAERFYNLVLDGFYDDVRFFRVLTGFVAQFGINGDPAVNTVWREQRIADDPVRQSNLRSFISFATSGANTRTTQVFINLADNSGLDGSGFSPFGRVIEGMDVVDALYADYGDGPPSGNGPRQDRIQSEGNAYLIADFPELDYVISATIE